MNTDGTGWTETSIGLVNIEEIYPLKMVTDGSKLYYAYSNYDWNVTDTSGLYTAESALDGTGWAATLRVDPAVVGATPEDLDMSISGTKLWLIYSLDDFSYSQIHTASLNTDGTGWTTRKQTNTASNKFYVSILAGTDYNYCVWLDITNGYKLYLAVFKSDNDGFTFKQRGSSTVDVSYVSNEWTRPYISYVSADIFWLSWAEDGSVGTTDTQIATSRVYKATISTALYLKTSGANEYIYGLYSDNQGRGKDFKTGSNNYFVFMNGTDKFVVDNANRSVTALTQAPYSNKFAVNAGRIYAAVGSLVKYCALNLVNDWTTANDAGEIIVTNAKGDITAITTFDGYITLWTEQSMHVLYGTGPSSFELREVKGGVGCISDRSVVVSNGILYWVSHDGLYSYGGGMPTCVSRKADEYFKNINTTYKTSISSGRTNSKMYVTMPYGASATSNNLVLAYDVERDKWYPETGSFIDFATVGNTLYGIIDSTGVTYDMASGTDDNGTAITWSWISGPLQKNKVKERKTLTDMWLTVDLPVGSTLTVSTSESVDGNDFTTASTVTANASEQVARIKVPYNKVQGSPFFRIKLDGTGPCKVYNLEQHYRVR
jgi:hypothetical protein